MTNVTGLLTDVVEWARFNSPIEAVALVGSHARGRARPESDIDLVLICHSPQYWLRDLIWLATFGRPERHSVEGWGKVTSVRVWYEGGQEVEFGWAPLDWAADPEDAGDRAVVSAGIDVLFDRHGELGRRVKAIRARRWRDTDAPE